MKKIKYLLLVFICIIIGNINVFALSKTELDKLEVSMGAKDQVCVYQRKSGNTLAGGSNLEYVVIKFAYNTATAKYEIGNPTRDGFAVSSKVTNLSSINDCGSYVVWYQDNNINIASSGYKYIPEDTNNIYSSITYNVKKSSSGSSTNGNGSSQSCNLPITNNKSVSFNIYQTTDKNTVFQENSADSKNICPASTDDGGSTFKRITVSKDNAVCSKWKVLENLGSSNYDISTCAYFLVDVNTESYRETKTVTENGELITTYVKFANANAPSIRILKNSDGTYKAVVGNGTAVDAITSSMISTNIASKTSYPKYLVKAKGTNSYSFTDEKPQEFDELYINVKYLTGIQGLGEAEIYKTCEEIFGESFLKWLDENVFIVIRIAVPILLILLTSFDFAKVVFSDDKEGMSNAFKRFTKRAIAAILIFLTPSIIMLIANLIGGDELKAVTDCVNYIENMHE